MTEKSTFIPKGSPYKSVHDSNGIGDYNWYHQKKEADVVSEELANIDISNRNYKGLWSALRFFKTKEDKNSDKINYLFNEEPYVEVYTQGVLGNLKFFRKELGFNFVTNFIGGLRSGKGYFSKVKSLDKVVEILEEIGGHLPRDYYNSIITNFSGFDLDYGRGTLKIERFVDKSGKEKVRVKDLR